MSTSPRHGWLATALTLAFASAGYTQAPATNQIPVTPDFTVQIWGFIVADFSARVLSYSQLRDRLQEGLPPLAVTDDPAEFKRAELALGDRIRGARSAAQEGDVFTPAITVEFRKSLLLEMDEATLKSIMSDNPGEFSHEINGTYPKSKPFSTTPANILALLPRLPDGIQYRFLGPHLILYDIRADLIIDRIPDAIN